MTIDKNNTKVDPYENLETKEKILGGNLKKKILKKGFKNENDSDHQVNKIVKNENIDQMIVEDIDESFSDYGIGVVGKDTYKEVDAKKIDINIKIKPEEIDISETNEIVEHNEVIKKDNHVKEPLISIECNKSQEDINCETETKLSLEQQEILPKTGFISIIGKAVNKQSIVNIDSSSFPPPPPPPPRELAYAPPSIRNRRIQLTSSKSNPSIKCRTPVTRSATINLPPLHPGQKSTYEERLESFKSSNCLIPVHIEQQYPRNTLDHSQNYPRRNQDRSLMQDISQSSSSCSYFSESSQDLENSSSTPECSPVKDNESRLPTFISINDNQTELQEEVDEEILLHGDIIPLDNNKTMNTSKSIVHCQDYDIGQDNIVNEKDCTTNENLDQNKDEQPSNLSPHRKNVDMFDNWREITLSPYSEIESSLKTENVTNYIDDSFSEFLQGGVRPNHLSLGGINIADTSTTLEPVTSAFSDLHLQDKTIINLPNASDSITTELDPFFKASNISMDQNSDTTIICDNTDDKLSMFINADKSHGKNETGLDKDYENVALGDSFNSYETLHADENLAICREKIDNACGDGCNANITFETKPKEKAMFKIPESYIGDTFKTLRNPNITFLDSSVDCSQSDINDSFVNNTGFSNIKLECVKLKKSYIISEKLAEEKLVHEKTNLSSIFEDGEIKLHSNKVIVLSNLFLLFICYMFIFTFYMFIFIGYKFSIFIFFIYWLSIFNFYLLLFRSISLIIIIFLN